MDSIYCLASLAAKRGGLLSLGIIVEYHQALWIEKKENRLLCFRKHDTIPPMARNLCLEDLKTIKIFNDTLHKRFVKNDIYRKSTIYMCKLGIHSQHT